MSVRKVGVPETRQRDVRLHAPTGGRTPISETDLVITRFFRATSSGPAPASHCAAIRGAQYPSNGDWVIIERWTSGLSVLELS